MRRPLAAAAAALLALARAGCSDSAEPGNVPGVIGAPDEEVFGEYVGEEFTDGPCVGWQDYAGTVYRQTWSYGEESGVPWVSDQRVAGNYEHSMDMDIQDEGDTCVAYFTATVSITNDSGVREGTFEGTSSWGAGAGDDQHLHDIDYTLTGTGDYDGLQYTFNLYGLAYPWDLTGTISPA